MLQKVLITVVLMFAVSTVNAGSGFAAEDRIEKLAIILDLNDTQKAAITEIFSARRSDMKNYREQWEASGKDLDRETLRQYREQNREETLSSVKAVLNAEQAEKFQALTELMPRPKKHGKKYRKSE